MRERDEKLRREKEEREKTEAEKGRREEEAWKKKEERRIKRKVEEEKERIENEKDEKERERRRTHPKLYSRVHSELFASCGDFECARGFTKYNGGNNLKWYEGLPFKDFTLFVTETDCTRVDFSDLWGKKYQENPEALKALSGMTLTVQKHTGKQEDNPYKKAFGDGFRKRSFYSSDPNGFTEIVTTAQPSEIVFVHETNSGHSRVTGKDLIPAKA